MHKFLKGIAATVLSISTLSSAHAGTVVCAGTVDEVAIHQPGLVAVRLSSMNGYLFVCRLDADYTPAGASTISSATCKGIYAALLTARNTGNAVKSAYFDGDAVPTSCNTVQQGSQVFLRFLDL